MLLRQPPDPVKHFLDRLLGLFDQRHAELVEPLLLGHGRRTATAWFRAADITHDFRRAYTLLGTLGRGNPRRRVVTFRRLRGVPRQFYGSSGWRLNFW
jgi:hypothetical protein